MLAGACVQIQELPNCVGNRTPISRPILSIQHPRRDIRRSFIGPERSINEYSRRSQSSRLDLSALADKPADTTKSLSHPPPYVFRPRRPM
jgi:hypothetical protein